MKWFLVLVSFVTVQIANARIVEKFQKGRYFTYDTKARKTYDRMCATCKFVPFHWYDPVMETKSNKPFYDAMDDIRSQITKLNGRSKLPCWGMWIRLYIDSKGQVFYAEFRTSFSFGKQKFDSKRNKFDFRPKVKKETLKQMIQCAQSADFSALEIEDGCYTAIVFTYLRDSNPPPKPFFGWRSEMWGK